MIYVDDLLCNFVYPCPCVSYGQLKTKNVPQLTQPTIAVSFYRLQKNASFGGALGRGSVESRKEHIAGPRILKDINSRFYEIIYIYHVLSLQS